MLTADLVRTRTAKGTVQPSFVDPSNERLRTFAADLLDAWRGGIGGVRADLEEQVAALVGDGTDHKLWKGVSKLIDDRAEWQVSAPCDLAALRALVFQLAAERGPVRLADEPGEHPRAVDLYAEAAERLGIDATGLPDALYADLAPRHVLARVDVPDAAWLLHRYNVALVQALLLHAGELDIALTAPSAARLRQLLRAVKFHQLIHAVQRADDGWRITVDGPASCLSQGTRYGIALARFFPALLLLPTAWSLTARIGGARGPRTLTLSSADGLRSHYRDVGGWEPAELTTFAERWTAADTGWEVSADAPPLLQGPQDVVVPDLCFRKDGRVAYLEVLGFWRKASLQRRVANITRHGPSNLVLAVSRRLSAEASAALPDAVVPFAEVIPVKAVRTRIEAVALAEP